MYPLRHNSLLKSTVAASLLFLLASAPATADEFVDNLGPVGAYEPILTSLGDKRVVAFYTPGSERCTLQAVVWDQMGPEVAQSAARVRVSLKPGQIVHIDTADDETLNLKCGDDAETLSITDKDERVAFGMISHATNHIMKANVSNF